jgi:hypothetical protein
VKLPYRVGDSFALPLGDGTFGYAQIERTDHHVITLAYGRDANHLVARARTYDEALVLHRWKVLARNVCPQSPAPTMDPISCAHVERRAAAVLGVAPFDDEPRRVRFTHRVAPASSVRVIGVALQRLDKLPLSETRRLILGGAPGPLPVLERVVDLDIQGGADLRAMTAAFPRVRRLRLGARGERVALRDLRDFGDLEVLELSDVAMESLAGIGELPKLRALRIVRVDGLRVLSPLAGLALRRLAVEQAAVTDIAVLATCRSLEELELIGFWHVELADAAWLSDMPALVRAEIDLGGRRKNVELYRRAGWAYPWPRFSAAATAVLN